MLLFLFVVYTVHMNMFSYVCKLNDCYLGCITGIVYFNQLCPFQSSPSSQIPCKIAAIESIFFFLWSVPLRRPRSLRN